MDARFSRALSRLNSTASARLADSVGSYTFGAISVSSIDLQIDHDLQMAGAGEVFQVDGVAITWAKSALAAVARGGVFTVGAKGWTVDKIIVDDGAFITAACMETA